MIASSAPQKPWFRQFWPWFLMAIPAWAVIAGVITVSVAMANRDSLVTDDYYKAGITINTALAEVDRAGALGIDAQLSPVAQRLLEVRLPASVVADAELQLQLRHPTQAAKDVSIRLIAQGGGRYTGIVEQALPGRWLVVLAPLEDAQNRWRLQGTWHNPDQQGLQLGLSKGA